MERDLRNSGDFIDKFDIPNRIIDRIVIVDGTSQTAARRAGLNPKVAHAKVPTRKGMIAIINLVDFNPPPYVNIVED